jgi:phosphomethylpyrimidine synthase
LPQEGAKAADFCSMRGPLICSMRIKEDGLRDGEKRRIIPDVAITEAMAERAKEFVEPGAEVYQKA